jgi:predicted TIM-barrel fold metal-dependent hydrolase
MHTTKIERIMYSVNYPFCNDKDGLKFMEELQKSGLLTEEQFEQVTCRNAEKLFNIKIQH